ncbi:aminotransferase class I/II-fold pyridoxal phosphate-dependent enzyme [Roseomonas sp. KE2513]|uniref:pyridoxal phosphate-dependent aminotransferase n=1 Tax=Roseomonas sp. KE2513 TaxID=2479202 RepID=UPI0018E007A3|nr:pyridoxal phosphate-dependent aminotransferase [Roseomonas sp. KE2513]MBI0534659.1 aminotransferase class I/II-fold pyridoxal phosphate-dependent enzyme [Roseomonas sp. KE2513]
MSAASLPSADAAPNLAGTLPARIQAVGTSQIGMVADRGRDDPEVVKLWIGEGDLPTPDFVVEAAHLAMQRGETRYTYSRGIPRLHQALSDYHRRHWGVEVAPERFAITAGGMNAIMQACQALLEHGDEVVIPTPNWPNLAEAVRVTGGVPVTVPYRRSADGHFSLPIEDIVAVLTPRTRVLVVNSPSNPTGWVMPLAEMEALRDLARERGLWIISDEVYGQFTYGNALAPSFLQICTPSDRLIVTNTFSKNWAMTGWRAGWVVYPEGLAATFAKLGQYNTTSIPTFIQHAAVAALDEGDGFIRTMVGRCAESRAIMVEGLSRLKGVTVFAPEGAFYLMARVETGETSLDLAFRFLREAKVGVAPGTAFGPEGEGFVRICFAVSPELAREAVARLTRVLGERAA